MRLVRSAVVLAAACLIAGITGEVLYRAWLSHRFRAEPVFELYAIGESSTYGEPYGPQSAFPELVKLMFDGRLAGRQIAVRNLGRPGDTLYPQSLELMKRLAVRDASLPAAVLIYSGHNEYFQRPRDRPRLAGAYAAFKRAFVYRSLLLSDVLVNLERATGWQGLRDETDYDYHLDRIITEARRHGAVPMLATLASNQSGIEPNVSCAPSGERACAEVEERIKHGMSLERSRDFDGAIKVYEPLLQTPHMRSLLEFRIGKCRAAEGRFSAARESFQAAIDDSDVGSFGRAKSGLNDKLRRFAAARGVPLVDAAALFAARSPHGIVGNELMSDGHHPNLAGYLILSEGFARALAAEFHEDVRRRLDEDSAAAATGLGPAERATALSHSGLWLLFVSIDHPEAEGRFAFARWNFSRAAALEPGKYEAWAGLGLTEAAIRADALKDPELVAAVKSAIFADGCPGADDARKLRVKLQSSGVEASVLAGLERSGRETCGLR